MATRTWEHLGTWQKNQWDDPRTGNSMVIPAKWAIWRKTVHPKSYDLLWCHHVRLSLSLTSTSKSVFGEPIKGNKGKVMKSLKTKVLYNLSPQTKYHALCSHDLKPKAPSVVHPNLEAMPEPWPTHHWSPKGNSQSPVEEPASSPWQSEAAKLTIWSLPKKIKKSQSKRFDTIWEADRS